MTGEMTDKQRDFIVSLLEKRDLSSLTIGQQAFFSDVVNLERLNKQKASDAIQLLKPLPFKTQASVETSVKEEPAEFANVSKGRYFIVDPTDSVEKFFKVDKPTDGRWKGYTFLHVQASDDFYPIKDTAHRNAVMAEIAKDPITAMNEYGIRLERCGCCGRTLTAKDSRLRGLGPVCAGRMRQFHQIELTLEDIQNLIRNADDA